jgi:hypothetical protein
LTFIGGAPGRLLNLTPEAVHALFADLMSDPQFTEAPVVAVMAGSLPGRVR